MRSSLYKAGVVLFSALLLPVSLLLSVSAISEAGTLPSFLDHLLPICGLVILILTVTSIVLFKQVYTKSLESRQLEAELVRLKHVDEQNCIHRRSRHDLYNHLTVISGLAQLGNTEQLLKYLDVYLAELNKGIYNVSSGVREVDILLYTKLLLAQKKAIDINVQCLEPLQCSHNNVVRIVSLLANALDNAIQAAANAGPEKKVDFSVAGDAHKYVIEVSNTYDPAIDLDSVLGKEKSTTKKGSEGGQGVGIIRRVVQNLQGTVRYAADSGLCNLRIEMPRNALGRGA